ncbi:MAG: metallopeptidase family protein [Actinomycetota bacterium]
MTTPEDRFMELAAEAVDGLPRWVHDALENVEIFVEDRPPPDEPGLLGRYQGVPLAKRGISYSGALPDRIELFREPIERLSRGSDDRLRLIIARTVAHEIAHHFGISDDRLREIGAY